MKNGWFEVEKDGEVIYWQSNLIEKVWIGKTVIEIWLINKQKYVFFSEEEGDAPRYMTVETWGLSISEFKKLKTYFKELIGIIPINKGVNQMDEIKKLNIEMQERWDAAGRVGMMDEINEVGVVGEVPSVAINREVGEVPIVILEYEDGFTVYPLEIDGVVSQGDTFPQAIHNVNDAISLHIESFGKKKLIPKDERAVKVFISKVKIS